MNDELLKLVRHIAKSYNYKPSDISYADDGKYKFKIYNDGRYIKFGKYGMMDFLLYIINSNNDDDFKNAFKRRRLYLKRSSKIKGDWKDDDFSKNNLSRRILWLV